MMGTILSSLAVGASAAPQLYIEGDRAVFGTDAMEVTIERGALVGLFNRLTRTSFFMDYELPEAEVPQNLQTGVVYAVAGTAEEAEAAGVVGETPLAEGQEVLKPELWGGDAWKDIALEKTGDLAAEYTFSGEGVEMVIRYELDPASGDLLVTQRASGSRDSLSGIRFGLGPVTCRGSLILPVFNGMKAMREESLGDYDKTRWEWPTGWSIALAIFDDPAGGFWIHAEDEAMRFKAIDYRYQGKGTWRVAFDSINHAPFSAHTSIDGVTWRINTYAGDWTVPMARYKDWAYSAYNMKEKSQYRPEWADDIKLQIKKANTAQYDDAAAYLDLLAQHVDPKSVLLYLHGGLSSGNERTVTFNEEARKRGFRTMYYELYFALFDQDPDFERFKEHIIRNPYTNAMMGWNLENEWRMDVKLYYVNPAYKPFRDYKIAKFRETFDKYPADGLFLDQSFLIFNDNNGKVDGKTIVDGNLAYHRDVLEAIPGIALGGEGINEISFQYESFCEVHPLGVYVDWEEEGYPWDINPAAFDRMVPVLTEFLGPHTAIMGYLAWPDSKHKYYPAWRDSLAVLGGIPTVLAPSSEDIENENSEVRHALRAAMARQ